MFESADRLVGIYKTNDITKCITYDPDFNEENKPKNTLEKEVIHIRHEIENKKEIAQE